jgi:hypothetical protein
MKNFRITNVQVRIKLSALMKTFNDDQILDIDQDRCTQVSFVDKTSANEKFLVQLQFSHIFALTLTPII